MVIEILRRASTADRINLRSLLYTASTHSQSDASFTFGYMTSERWAVLVSESYRSREVEEAIRAYHALVPKRTVKEEETEEREWDRIVNKPHVRQALRRMATDARRQYFTGETEEGGFGLE